ncbi:hypothetical protein [Saccharopolyspora cebuensis]|uniref:Uncharacterized protein n=1 Tax=Saccharopolyspora cebuensis TaxID=418759 RepID=A0ABV4CMI0_9PSEU
MLLIVLLLVVAAAGVLAAAVGTGHPGWAWYSVLLSALAVLLLVLDRIRRRRAAAPGRPVGSGPEPEFADAPEVPEPEVGRGGEPAADAEVLVVDEHPRYHLTGCDWIAGQETIPLPLAEARELGFTPCGVCAPDSTLAARPAGNR